MNSVELMKRFLEEPERPKKANRTMHTEDDINSEDMIVSSEPVKNDDINDDFSTDNDDDNYLFNRQLNVLKTHYPLYDFSNVRPSDNLSLVEAEAISFEDDYFYD